MEDSKAYFRIIMNLPPATGDPALAIPLLRDFSGPPGEALLERLERRYRRLCRVQEELKRLNSINPINASGGGAQAEGGGSGTGRQAGNRTGRFPSGNAASFEDFVFSQTDFSRYGKLSEEDFDFFIRGLEDFDEIFFTLNFRINGGEAEAAIRKNYKKIATGSGAFYCLLKGNPLIFSIMRSLETSLESRPLIREEEISGELGSLYGFLNQRKGTSPRESSGLFTRENTAPFFWFLVRRLDGLSVTHRDGNKTGLFLTAEGLRGTFMPGGKNWTLTLIPGVFI